MKVKKKKDRINNKMKENTIFFKKKKKKKKQKQKQKTKQRKKTKQKTKKSLITFIYVVSK